MRKKLVWSGNSAALVIDTVLLRLLKLKVGSYVDIATDGHSLVLRKSEIQSGDDSSRAPAREAARNASPEPSATETDGQMSEAEWTRLMMRAPALFEQLVRRWSIPFEVFQALYHGPAKAPDPARGPLAWLSSLAPYRHWVDTDARYDSTPAQLATIQRFDACYEAKLDGARWDQATAYALQQVPMLREPDDVDTVATALQSVPQPGTPAQSLSS